MTDDYLEWRVAQLKDIMSLEYRKPAYEIDEATDTLLMAPDLAESLVMTMRFAVTMRGAPKNCRNPACRTMAASCGWRKTATASAPAA